MNVPMLSNHCTMLGTMTVLQRKVIFMHFYSAYALKKRTHENVFKCHDFDARVSHPRFTFTLSHLPL